MEEFKNVHYVTAGAGAGKTTTLVDIIKELVDERGADPERMILTTYTKAAATEFREKSKAVLSAENAVKMNAARIGTVHSIASSYINRYWYLLGISPSVKPMNKTMSEVLMNRSLEKIVTGKETAVFKEYVRTFGITSGSDGYDDDFWKNGLRELFKKMRGYRFDKEKLTEFRDKSLELLKRTFDAKENQALLNAATPVLREYLSYKPDVDRLSTDAKKAKFEEKCILVREILATKPEDFTVKKLKEYAGASQRWTNCPAVAKKGPEKVKFDPLFEQSHNDTGEAVANLAQHLVPKEYTLILTVTKQMFDMMEQWMDSYSKLKDENGLIDYEDMEEKFYLLLQEKEVLEDIEKSVDYLFVDEFQDSTPIQADIFRILSNHIRQTWFVGDRKQAIYGFAGSDAGLIGELAKVFPTKTVDSSIPVDSDKDDKGNSSRILKTSHRSVPSLVKTANDIFTEVFDVLEPYSPLDRIPKEQVKLDPKEGKADPGWDTLHHVFLDGDSVTAVADALATAICAGTEDHRFEEAGYSRSDIAVLARWNSEVKAIASALRKKGIPTAAINPDVFLDTPEIRLIVDILKLSAGIDWAKSRAEIRKILSDEDFAKLTDRMKKGADNKNKNTLDDFPGLDAFAKSLRTLSVSDRIDEIVTRFDLHGICGFWDSPKARRSNINLLRQAAAEYTDQSMTLCTAADVRGFLAYLGAFAPEAPFDNTADGVKVLTYHKAKGLDWKIVVLFGLDKYKDAKDISGVTGFGKLSEPDFLRLIPRLPDKDWVTDCIIADKEAEELLLTKQAAQRGEERRLLYVGFTRAKDVVITTSTDAAPVVIDHLCPTVKNRTTPPDEDHADIWGVGRMSTLHTIADDSDMAVASGDTPVRYDNAGFYLPKKTDAKTDPKYLSPSKYKDPIIQAAATPKTVKDFDARMNIGHKDLTDNEFGDCLHHLFAVCEPGKQAENLVAAERTLKAFGIDDADAPAKALEAIERFFDWLAKEYGDCEKLDREVPFLYEDDKGHVFSGNMDLIWRTAKGTVLVDYKTFSGSRADLFNPASDHWAGKYATQLDVYARALAIKDGRAPLARLLYYPVEGLVITP